MDTIAENVQFQSFHRVSLFPAVILFGLNGLIIGVIPNPKMAFIFPISCILTLIFQILIIYFPKGIGKGSFLKSQIKSLSCVYKVIPLLLSRQKLIEFKANHESLMLVSHMIRNTKSTFRKYMGKPQVMLVGFCSNQRMLAYRLYYSLI